jgi:hypothetical protein
MLVNKIILYYDERSKKHQIFLIHLLTNLLRMTTNENLKATLKSVASYSAKRTVSHLREFTMANKAPRYFKTSVNIFQSIWRNIPDHSNLPSLTCSFTFLFAYEQICKHNVTSSLSCNGLNF